MSALHAFTLHNAENPAFPVLLSVPHAGRDYPGPLLDALRVAAGELLRLEDRYADRLVQPAIAAGFPAIIAHRARAWVDLNRAEQDFDAGMFGVGRFSGGQMPDAVPSAKTRGGLGLIPRRLQSCGDLWRRPFDATDYEERVVHFHRPYHQAIRDTLAAMRARFGIAILLDVHSMPPVVQPRGHNEPRFVPPQFVVGDRFGRSAADYYSESILAHLRARGFAVALNTPYAGDHILDTHGAPPRNIHAIQLEVDRSLYLDASWREPSAELPATAHLIREIATELADQAQNSHYAEAAE
jgi:N-formylglutamate amidohydrolase